MKLGSVVYYLSIWFLSVIVISSPRNLYSQEVNKTKLEPESKVSSLANLSPILLDFRNFNFSNESVRLQTDWNFYPHQLLTGSESSYGSLPDAMSMKIAKQGIWNSYLNEEYTKSQLDASFAVGTYMVDIQLPSEDLLQDPVLYVKILGGAYRIYWNGTYLGENGNFQNEQDFSRFQPSRYEQIYLLKNIQPINRLAIQLSNFGHPRGGLWTSPIIGSHKLIDTSFQSKLTSTSFIAGGLILLGLYQFVQYSVRRFNYRSLLFSCFCFLASLRILSMGEIALHYIFPQIPTGLFIRFEYLGFYASVLITLYYVHSLAKQDTVFSKKWCHLFLIFFLVPILLTIFGPQYHITRTLFPMQVLALVTGIAIIYTLIQVFRFSNYGRHWLVASFLVLVSFSVYDIYISILNYREGFMLSFGLLIFSLFQTIYISILSSEEQKEAEQGLKAAQYQLIQSEKLSTLGVMVAGVAHEINSPLGAIQSSSSSLEERLKMFWKNLPNLTLLLEKEGFQKIQNWIDLSEGKKKFLSSKEERENRRQLTRVLEDSSIEANDELIDKISDLGIHSLTEERIQELKEESHKYLDYALAWKQILDLVVNIYTASIRAGKIVLSLKTFTHFDPNANITNHNIIDSIENVLTVFENSIKKGIQIEKEFEEIPSIPCYPDELTQVWTNLIHNAIQAMDGRGNLKIQVKTIQFQNKPYIQASFLDSGKGVPKEFMEKIFDPFFTTKPVGEGTGLGLHITKQIIEKHNGIIQLDSKIGQTCFKILLPCPNKIEQ